LEFALRVGKAASQGVGAGLMHVEAVDASFFQSMSQTGSEFFGQVGEAAGGSIEELVCGKTGLNGA
jgi:hypothetical protein